TPFLTNPSSLTPLSLSSYAISYFVLSPECYTYTKFNTMHLLIFFHNEYIYKSADARAHGPKSGEPTGTSIAPFGRAVVPIEQARGRDATVEFSVVGGVSTKLKDEIC
ncbi:MAG: hypothetical protein OXF62_11330, partial [Caldilineaceae bacterium]|nr:hypothetical protein [Caldilineaceae bacterium]